jgi:hypothetical protein
VRATAGTLRGPFFVALLFGGRRSRWLGASVSATLLNAIRPGRFAAFAGSLFRRAAFCFPILSRHSILLNGVSISSRRSAGDEVG